MTILSSPETNVIALSYACIDHTFFLLFQNQKNI